MSTTIEEPQTTEDTPLPEPEDKTPIPLTLFDKAVYNNPNKTSLKFTGNVELDLSDALDHELIPEGGGNITLMVECFCSRQSWKFDQDEDGNVSGVRLEHAVNVHTVYRPVA